eukprot:gene9870-13207_t
MIEFDGLANHWLEDTSYQSLLTAFSLYVTEEPAKSKFKAYCNQCASWSEFKDLFVKSLPPHLSEAMYREAIKTHKVTPDCRPTFAGFALKALNEQRKIPENLTQVATTLLKDCFPLKLTERVSALASWRAWMDDMPSHYKSFIEESATQYEQLLELNLIAVDIPRRIAMASTTWDNAVPTISSTITSSQGQPRILAVTEDPG